MQNNLKIHYMKLQKEPFESIKNGIKTIELRLYDGKRKLIKPDDLIKFSLVGGEASLFVRVIKLHLFDSFKALYEAIPLRKCGYVDASKASFKDMERYYSNEEQASFGVVGIEFELINGNSY